MINTLTGIGVFFINNSSNKKTGNIAQCYTSANTCPTRCPFKQGCYGKNYGTCFQWKKATTDINKLIDIVEDTCDKQIIRHNVAGDIAIPGTSQINLALVSLLLKAYEGRHAYTYTHCEVNKRNIAIVRYAIKHGFTINFSCENLEQVKICQAAGVPSVLAVDTMEGTELVEGPVKLVKCDAIYSNKQCAGCLKCLNARRGYTVVFEAHGTQRKKAVAGGNLVKLGGPQDE